MDDRGAVSRRAVLLGGGALALGGVAAAAGATALVGWTDTLHKLGVASSPDREPKAKGAPVRTGYFKSVALDGAAFWAIATPPEPKAVVICLHGRGGDHLTAFNTIHVHRFAADADLPLAVVGVDGGVSSYWHQRASGFDPQAMLHDELLPRVAERVGDVPRAVLGWSMGGYGALLTAERHPHTYKVVVASSPALFTNPTGTPAGAFDGPDDFRRNDVLAEVDALTMTVRVDCGTNDPFLRNAKAFAAKLPHANPGSFTRGFHDASYWRSVAPSQLATIASALGL